MIGVHGNGLTHQLWMPSGGTVVELFPRDAFLRDYQVVAEALGHHHIVIVRIPSPFSYSTMLSSVPMICLSVD